MLVQHSLQSDDEVFKSNSVKVYSNHIICNKTSEFGLIWPIFIKSGQLAAFGGFGFHERHKIDVD